MLPLALENSIVLVKRSPILLASLPHPIASSLPPSSFVFPRSCFPLSSPRQFVLVLPSPLLLRSSFKFVCLLLSPFVSFRTACATSLFDRLCPSIFHQRFCFKNPSLSSSFETVLSFPLLAQRIRIFVRAILLLVAPPLPIQATCLIFRSRRTTTLLSFKPFIPFPLVLSRCNGAQAPLVAISLSFWCNIHIYNVENLSREGETIS